MEESTNLKFVSPSVQGSNSPSEIHLEECSYEDGLKSYRLEINPNSEFVRKCKEADDKWNIEFKKFIASNYPYTMSPQSTEFVAEYSVQMVQEMKRSGFAVETWLDGDDSSNYVLGVLRRVLVPDTIEPIIHYTDGMAEYLKALKVKNPNLVPTIRSFFCGACVADKCLLARLEEFDISSNFLTSDSSGHSLAIGGLNIALWNIQLNQNSRYEIHFVNGKIPKDLYSKQKVIVLQKEDALVAARMDTENNPNIDVLLIDNGLPYVTRGFARDIFEAVLKNAGSNGLYWGALGLDQKIKVEISSFTHFMEILKSTIFNLREIYKKIYEREDPRGYFHKYIFTVKENGEILIHKVYSDGAARTYTWLKYLLFNNPQKFKEVMSAIKSATGLSGVSEQVITPPFDYHEVILGVLEKQGLNFEIIDQPLGLEKLGWEKKDDDVYIRKEQPDVLFTAEQIAAFERCKSPVVLQRTVGRTLFSS